MPEATGQRGFALITVLLLLAVVATLISGYFTLTRFEQSSSRSAMDGTRGLYAAEAGLNVRAELVRQVFQGYNRPAGTSPYDTEDATPCADDNRGGGDFACVDYAFAERQALTYVVEAADNPMSIVIPRGELFQNLHAQEYRYTINSTATGPLDRPEALLEMRFKSRLVPMFQFVAFYGKDLEILPGPSMNLEGPVHTNGNLYLGTDATLDIHGQVTTAGDLYRGRKNQNICMPGTVRVADPDDQLALPCAGGRTLYDEAALAPWNGMIRNHVEVLTIPPPEALDPTPGQIYWDKADLRIVLDVNGGAPEVQVRTAGGAVDAAASATLAGCGSATHSNSFYNNREATLIRMLDIDMRDLLDCMHADGLLGAGKDVDESSEGGLVLYLAVDGPASGTVNNYGVRVRNGAELAASDALAPEVRGLTVVTNQAAYVQGSYNATDKKPAAFLADSLNVLSNNFVDATSTQLLNTRVATATTINAAFLAGTDTTAGIEGAGGHDLNAYNGGLENFPRFHENWTGRTFTYRGSFVSLNRPLHVDGPWVYGAPSYTAPVRDWGFDTDFNDAANLPPLSPRFVYLRQELFTRDYER